MLHEINIRTALSAAHRMDEAACIAILLELAKFSESTKQKIQECAYDLVTQVRQRRLGRGGIDVFLAEYPLSSEAGLALVSLAEALLRIPDAFTMNQLIREKLTQVDWSKHLHGSDSLLVNIVTHGLQFAQRILNISQISQPVVRVATKQAIKIVGRQFVMGDTIEAAMKRARAMEKQGYRYSYDMLGEAACGDADVQRYFTKYQHAIESIGRMSIDSSVFENPGISIKLSALHARYEFAQRDRVLRELVPRLKTLAMEAKKWNISLTIDAEEADRLELSLDVIERVFCDSDLDGWEGFGVAVQAYQKRALPLLDELAVMVRRCQRRLMIRLVKGAYWDTEIKLSQQQGLEDYPVFTRKTHTDVSFLACVKKIIALPEIFYPMFGTHNVYSVAAILVLMEDAQQPFEFQCLHGMGQELYAHIIGKFPCRIYAPVGEYQDLLPYLVRRLLENGANSSFVHALVDHRIPIEQLIADPVEKALNFKIKTHTKIPLPADIYGARRNSAGVDLSSALTSSAVIPRLVRGIQVKGKFSGFTYALDSAPTREMTTLNGMTTEDVEKLLQRATAAINPWRDTSIEHRAVCLERAADLFEQHRAALMDLIIHEGGKTIPDALAEVREAVDFCRYYAQQAREILPAKFLVGATGETNQFVFIARGVFACISPWNFPLAIFVGQISAALVAGNVVIAKPAGQTPGIAQFAVQLLHQAGVPEEVLQLLTGKSSEIGQMLVADPRIHGIIFTGSTETAKRIHQTLAQRPGPIIPLIAETGGQNVMIVDSSALTEQVVTDVISSAFRSAGQRCSACRVLFLQEEIADRTLVMLQSAMAELSVGDPNLLATDIGPVIDEAAKNHLEKHVAYLNNIGNLVYRVALPENIQQNFFAPCVYEIPNLNLLTQEVFGPILHVIRYSAEKLDDVIDAINSTGYGLTLGIQSRVHATIAKIFRRASAGNIYVNRNMIGAVVGVQPFGGEGLSGTGPKSGGPNYLQRLCTERVLTINISATGGNAALICMEEE